MPRPYQKTITVHFKTYEKAKEKADNQDKSVAKYVTELILKDKPEED